MKLRSLQQRIKITARRTGKRTVRMQLDDLEAIDGRKTFSFNVYQASLSEVMKLLVQTFEKATKDAFPLELKKELGMSAGIVQLEKRSNKNKGNMVKEAKRLIKDGHKVAVPGLMIPDGWMALLKNQHYEVFARPLYINKDNKKMQVGYLFFRKID